MRKNRIAAVFVSAVVCLQMASCGNSSKTEQTTTTATTTAAATTTTAAAAETTTAAETAAPAETTAAVTEAAQPQPTAEQTEREVIVNELPNTKDYTLKEVVVLSRHNIRAPLSSGGAVNVIATPHEWFEWTCNPSELSLRGGVLETEMGQYFRKWLESEEFIPENWLPEKDEVRIYANSKQRTLATAQYFSGGFLPASNLPIEHHAEFNTMDETFNPKMHFCSDAYIEAVQAQLEELGGASAAAELEENYKLLADVIDYTESEAYKKGELTDLVTDDTSINIELGEEPNIGGSLRTASTISDALVLQYYEEPDPVKAAFGNELTQEQWQQIADITTKYSMIRHSLPLIAINAANPLLKEIRSELGSEKRKFAFLCGHDVNITQVLTAMGAEDYSLPHTLERKTPIGVKLVFEKWADKEGKEFAVVEMIYQSTEQLRSAPVLTVADPPARYVMSFDGLEKNSDGLYSFDDLSGRLDKAISAYDEILAEYGGDEAEEKVPEAA